MPDKIGSLFLLSLKLILKNQGLIYYYALMTLSLPWFIHYEEDYFLLIQIILFSFIFLIMLLQYDKDEKIHCFYRIFNLSRYHVRFVKCIILQFLVYFQLLVVLIFGSSIFMEGANYYLLLIYIFILNFLYIYIRVINFYAGLPLMIGSSFILLFQEIFNSQAVFYLLLLIYLIVPPVLTYKRLAGHEAKIY